MESQISHHSKYFPIHLQSKCDHLCCLLLQNHVELCPSTPSISPCSEKNPQIYPFAVSELSLVFLWKIRKKLILICALVIIHFHFFSILDLIILELFSNLNDSVIFYAFYLHAPGILFILNSPSETLLMLSYSLLSMYFSISLKCLCVSQWGTPGHLSHLWSENDFSPPKWKILE